MRWQGDRQSDNVEDRRGDSGGGGGGGGFGIGGRSVGLGTVAIAVVAGWIFGVNPLTVLGLLSGGGGPAPTQQAGPAARPAANDQEAAFVSTVLGYTEDVWSTVFREAGASYSPPKLVLFRGRYPTACGTGEAAMGPFYCPGDQKVYIDLSFYDTLKRQLGSPGDFAQAYVVAHEVGHHVQNLLGITDKVDGRRGRISETQMNALSVRVELQADCFAGIWAKRTNTNRQNLETGDIEEALNAAAHIGDDALQQQSQGTVRPESFTHGSSAQRVSWFKRGLQSGEVKDCDTFAARQL